LFGLWALAELALRWQKFTTSAWTVLSLWLLLLVSELRIMNQVGDNNNNNHQSL
jgi:hypothetical protein